MKKLNFFGVLIALTFAIMPFRTNAQAAQQLQPGTICIKSPVADNADQYFGGLTVFYFEVYKISPKQMTSLISAFKADPAVEYMSAAELTGDFQAFNLSLKSNKNKDWFKKTFKSAGLSLIRLNRQDVLPIDEL